MEDKKTRARAKDLAYRYLALRDRSRLELSNYLDKKGVPAEAAGKVLGEFESAGYIDDRKFAEKYARYLIEKKGLSRYALGFELSRKGVSRPDSDGALALVFGDGEEGGEGVVDDFSTALRAATRKAASMGRIGPDKARRRLTDYLRRRGFSFDVIRKALVVLDKG